MLLSIPISFKRSETILARLGAFDNKIIYLLGKLDDPNITRHFINQGCIVKALDYTRNEYNKTDSSGKQIIERLDPTLQVG